MKGVILAPSHSVGFNDTSASDEEAPFQCASTSRGYPDSVTPDVLSLSFCPSLPCLSAPFPTPAIPLSSPSGR